ncbi:unnamed protein product [Prunus armeniaca]
MGDNSIVGAVAVASANLCVSDYIPSTGSNTWGHVVLSTTYLINRTPSRVLDFKTLHDVFGEHVSPVSVSKLPLKVFGCVAYVHVYSHQRSKLDSCALRCVFIGYTSTQKDYKCYHPLTQKGERGSELKSLGLENLGLELENDVFEDTALGKKTTSCTEASDWSPIFENETCARVLDETTDHTDVSDWSPVSESSDSDSCMDELNAIPPFALPVPQSTHDSESNAMNVEMKALNKNETWDLVHLLRGNKAVGCRWVFILKHKANGSIDRYKTRLVAKGYTQTYGVDYLETFAPIAKLNTVNVLLSLAANRD